jgi:hypothetical protein
MLARVAPCELTKCNGDVIMRLAVMAARQARGLQRHNLPDAMARDEQFDPNG